MLPLGGILPGLRLGELRLRMLPRYRATRPRTSLSAPRQPHTDSEPTHLRHPENHTTWTATGHERPVFLDEHGRRRRWVLLGGALSGGASALWFAALLAGAIGFSTLPSLQTVSPLLAARREAHGVALAGPHRRQIVAHRPSVLAHRTLIVAQQRRQTSLALLIRPAASRGAIRGE